MVLILWQLHEGVLKYLKTKKQKKTNQTYSTKTKSCQKHFEVNELLKCLCLFLDELTKN